MGQTESLININKNDWDIVILTALLANYAFAAAHVPIWVSQRVVRSYSRQKNWYRKYLLNPKVWYDGFLWWAIFLFGAAWAIYRMLKILRNSTSGTDERTIYLAEIALLISTIQLGVHGLWAIPWFYWRQAFWSILIMGLATCTAIGAYIPMLMVDPITSGITYGIYIFAQLVFTIGNTYLFVKGYDKRIDSVKNPVTIYFAQKLYPMKQPQQRKKKEKTKETR